MSDWKYKIRQRYLKIDSANIADVLDDMGLSNQGLSPIYTNFTSGESSKMAGWAYTIQGAMAPYEGSGDKNKMAACAGIGKYDLPVWSGNGEGVCFFGELIAIGMIEKGAVGSLVDGGIRDREWIRKLSFPVFAKYRTSVQSIRRWKVTGYGDPVYMRGACSSYVVVNVGDFVFGDIDGAIVIPSKLVEEVLVKVEELTKVEAAVRKDIENGLSLSDALERYGHV